MGETLHFPTNTEEVQSLLKRIGVDGVRCQEYFIISFDSDILGLYDYLGEYENIDELNHLAHLLKELSPSERETLEAVMDSGQHCGSVQDLINLTQIWTATTCIPVWTMRKCWAAFMWRIWKVSKCRTI